MFFVLKHRTPLDGKVIPSRPKATVTPLGLYISLRISLQAPEELNLQPLVQEDAANGSGMCVQLICTAMSEGPGVPIEDPNTEVRVQPEEALALVVAHVARQAARPVPPTAAARRSQTTGDRDKVCARAQPPDPSRASPSQRLGVDGRRARVV